MVNQSISEYMQQLAQYINTVDKILSSDYVIDLISNSLKGKVFDEKGKLKLEGKPLVNDEGYHQIMLILRMGINPNTKLGVLDIREIQSLAGEISKEVAVYLSMHGNEAGFDQRVLDMFCKSLYSILYFHMSSSKDGKLLGNLTRNIQVIQQTLDREDKK